MWLFQKWHWKTIRGGKGGGPNYPSLQPSVYIGIFQYNMSIILETRTTNFWWMENGETTISYVKIGFIIQLKTTIYKWMFQVPGICWSIPWHEGLATKKHRNSLRISEDMLRIPHELLGCCNTFAPRLVACFIPSNIRICHWATKQTLLLSIMLVVY